MTYLLSISGQSMDMVCLEAMVCNVPEGLYLVLLFLLSIPSTFQLFLALLHLGPKLGFNLSTELISLPTITTISLVENQPSCYLYTYKLQHMQFNFPR